MEIGGGSGTYSTQVSGNDLILTVGDGSILLRDTANLSIINIYGEEKNMENVMGTANADIISNSVSGATVDALGGDDTISNNGANVLISGGDGNDSIDNFSDNVTIAGGTGADSIFNYNKGVSISGGDGNDYIFNNANPGDTTTIDGGAGDDTIEVSSNFNPLVINGGDGDDSIVGIDEGGTINGGKGNDTISVGFASALFTYTSGDGDDVIDGFNSSSTLQIGGGSGIYSTQESGNDIIVTVGDGSILLKNAANLSTINIVGKVEESSLVTGTEGNDSINNSLAGALIQALGGNDTVENNSANVTIDAGGGDDSITNWASNVTIDGGTGDDEIYNWTGATVSISGGDGNEFIRSGASGVTINGDADNDTINNLNASNVSMAGGTGDDSILNNHGNSVTISGSTGADFLNNYGGSNVTIDGGADNDKLLNSGENVSMNGGDGNDEVMIFDGSKNVTMIGGLGNDTISINGISNILIEYNVGDGNDTVLGFNLTSTLQISGSTYYTQISGNDIIVTVGDGSIQGSILLKDAASLSIASISGEYYNSLLITGTEGADNITNRQVGATINALGGNDNINSYGANSIVDAGAGNDYVYNNNSSNVSVSGGDGDDTLETNFSSNVTVDGGAGDDYLVNGDDHGSGGDSILFLGGAGNDFLANYEGSASSLYGGDDNDTLYNDSGFVIMDGGDGNDSISHNYAANVTITAGKGDDTIKFNTYANNNLIKYTDGDGNDTIEGFHNSDTLQIGGGSGIYYTQVSGSDILVSVGSGSILLKGVATLSKGNIAGTYEDPFNVEGTEGDDTINNTFEGATINALGGNDIIYNDAVNVTINAGAGNDSIGNHGGHENGNDLIDAGDGNDTIDNHANRLTLKGGAGDDSIYNGSYNVSIDGGDGNDTIISESPSNNVTINGGTGNDLISFDFNAENALIQYTEGDGNDTIEGFHNSDTLQIGGGSGTYSTQVSGNDIIVIVGGDSILLKGVATLSNANINGTYKKLLVNGTEDADTIRNIDAELTIKAGAGNDSIRNSGDNVTINGGTGNDTITNSGENVVFQYANGDGNDTINGFDETSTLQIGDGTGTYSTQVSGSDLIVNVGDGSILLKDVANSSFSIAGEYKNPLLIFGTDGADEINNTISGATIQALLGSDYIENSGNAVLIDAGAGNDEITNSGSNATITGGDGKDTIANSGTAVSINGGAGNDVINFNGGTATINVSEGNDTIYIGTTLDASFTVEDFDIGDVISLEYPIDSLTAIDGGIIAGNATISGLSSVKTDPAWTLDGKIATYTEGSYGGATLSDDRKRITYSDLNIGKTLVTINGVTSTEGLVLDGKVVSVGAAALSGVMDSVTMYGDGYTLTLGKDVALPESISAGWEYDSSLWVATYNTFGTTAGYSLNGNQIRYVAASGETVTISGVQSADGITVDTDKKIVTVGASALQSGGFSGIVTVSEGYELKLGSDVEVPQTVAGWSLNGTTATYNKTGTTAGYRLANNQISYVAASGEILVTVTGVKDTKGLTLIQTEEENAVAVYSSALDPANTVTVSDGFTLELGSDVEESTLFSGYWTPNGNNIAYRINETTKGYRVIDNQISYTDSIEGGTLAEFSGIAANSTPVVPETYDVISFTPGNFAGNIAVVSSSVGNFEFNAGDYADKAFTGSDNSDSITNAGSNLIIDGGAGNDYIVNSGASVFFQYNAGGGDDTIEGFNETSTLKIGGDSTTYYKQIKDNDIIVKFDDGSVLLKGLTSLSNVNIEGGKISDELSWTLNDTTAIYGTGTETLITVTGVKSLDGISLSGDTVTVAASALNSTNVSISDGYKLGWRTTRLRLKLPLSLGLTKIMLRLIQRRRQAKITPLSEIR